MPPLHTGAMDELFFLGSSNSDPQNITTPQDKVLDYVPNLYTNMESRGQQPKLLLATGQRENISNDEDKKKSLHRNTERQRRQEMATLHASLRTLLPLEYIKGKRATSDHMNAAVSYIKDLQKRIDDLSAKRDELKKLSGSSSGFNHEISSSYNESFPSTAVVRQSLEGVEVVISTGVGAKALTLSRVLGLLLEEGLDVVRCISTRIDGGLIHTIQSKVNDLTCVDVPRLEQKLNEEISSLTQFS